MRKQPSMDELRQLSHDPRALAVAVADDHHNVLVTGGVANRALISPAGTDTYTLRTLGSTIGAHPISTAYAEGMVVDKPDADNSDASISSDTLYRLALPKVSLVSLTNPNRTKRHRFPLAISNLAAAIRQQMIGQVSLADMQFEPWEEILARMQQERADIVGISTGFMPPAFVNQRIAEIRKQLPSSIVIIGGPLAAADAEQYSCHPDILIGTGRGEETMQDLVHMWHGDILKANVRHIIHPMEIIQRTSKSVFRGVVPELDLLPMTLQHGGTMVMELSEGCNFACTFCPRAFHGRWSGVTEEVLSATLTSLDFVYAAHPEARRHLTFADEEVLGDNSAEAFVQMERKLAQLKEHNFTSYMFTRVDRIYDPEQTPKWHEEAIGFWKRMRKNGLSKCFVGVESIVDSQLERFNKKVTADQNITGLRLLSTCDIGLHIGFIIFDHLMTMDELIQTYEQLKRDDVLLRPNPNQKNLDMLKAVQDPTYVEQWKVGTPLYQELFQTLSTLDVLKKARFRRMVQDAGLTTDKPGRSIGSVDALYRDPLIGVMAGFADEIMKVDFAINSGLRDIQGMSFKELIKIKKPTGSNYAYAFLGKMLAITNANSALIAECTPQNEVPGVQAALEQWQSSDGDMQVLHTILNDLLREHVTATVEVLNESFSQQMKGAYALKEIHQKLNTTLANALRLS